MRKSPCMRSRGSTRWQGAAVGPSTAPWLGDVPAGTGHREQPSETSPQAFPGFQQDFPARQHFLSYFSLSLSALQCSCSCSFRGRAKLRSDSWSQKKSTNHFFPQQCGHFPSVNSYRVNHNTLLEIFLIPENLLQPP